MCTPRTIFVVAASLASGLAVGLAGEGGAVASPSRDQAARAHFMRGAALFQQRDYANAWLEFNSAYQIAPKPALLYNMARCEMKLGKSRDALVHLRSYLAATPNDPDADQIRRDIATLEGQIAREGEAPPPGAGPVVDGPPVVAARRPWPVKGTVAAVVTTAFLIAGAATLGSVDSRYNALKNECAPNCAGERVDPLTREATAGYVLMGLAGAGAVTTGLLLYYELRPRPERKLTLLPLLGPGYAGVSGRF